MEESPQKRVLTEALYQETRVPQSRPHSEMLPAELIARLANVGRRVRYNVSQGYASNRTTPLTTPNVSPSKSQPVNPYNTPQVSPVRRNIFKTETEVIQEAVEELHISPKKSESTSQEPLKPTRGVKKRGRDELDDSSDSDADGEYEEASEPENVRVSPERVKKPLQKKKFAVGSAQKRSSPCFGWRRRRCEPVPGSSL